MEQIHQGHLGTSKCQYRARQCVYWPGINKDIEQLVEACATCQRHRPQEPRQPLKPTPPPERPWQQLGADFMMFNGSEYLVIVDYYSKMPIVRKMPTSQCNSAKMITVLKELLAEHGCRAIKQGMVKVNTWVFILRQYKWHIHAGSWSLVNCWREGSTLPYKGCS